MSSNNRNNDRGSAPSYSSPSPVASAPRQSAPAHSRAPDPVRVASVQQGSPFRVVDTSARIQVGGPMSLSEPVAGGYDPLMDGDPSRPVGDPLGVFSRKQTVKRLSRLRLELPTVRRVAKGKATTVAKPAKRKIIQKPDFGSKPGRKSVSKKAASTEKATSTSKTSSPEKAREKVATCKARPENNKPKGSGGSGKDFVPWCK